VNAPEQVVEMNNGCICCTVRGDLIVGLKSIMKKSEGKPLDGVLIETTGLADPAPVAQTFFADDFVQRKMRLDGILTVVDAKHIVQHLDEEKPEGVENEAVEQLAFADRVLLNKCDLVEEATLKDVEERILSINSTAKVQRTVQSQVAMDFILGIRAFSLDKILDMEEGFLDDDGGDHQHDYRVKSIGIDEEMEVDMQKLVEWLQNLLQTKGNDLYRCKGIFNVKGKEEKFLIQVIHMQCASSFMGSWGSDEKRRCKVCFIGKDLDRKSITDAFMACRV
jgi:G3E family GTPase